MSRAAISRLHPRAIATCDRCGFRYNHDQLQWQLQWTGPHLQNLRILVCKSCLDVPQEQLRTIILPPDPVPIENPRPEQYVSDNNPNSPIGQSASPSLPGSNIGTLIGGGGTYSAFMGSTNKPFAMSANLGVSDAGIGNWVGKDWSAAQNAVAPTTVASTGVALVATGFEVTAPSDAPFLGAGVTIYAFQGSSDAVNWTTLASTFTSGAVGETITVNNLGGNAYRYHRFVFLGDGVTPAAVAYLAIDTNRGYSAL